MFFLPALSLSLLSWIIIRRIGGQFVEEFEDRGFVVTDDWIEKQDEKLVGPER